MSNEIYEDHDLSDLEELEELDNISIARKSSMLKDRINPLEHYKDQEFRDRYRFNKDIVMEVIFPKVSEPLSHYNNNGLPIPPLLQLLAALRFYGSGLFEINNGDLHHTQQSPISKIVKRVSTLLYLQLGDTVKFPENLDVVKNKFFAIDRFPEVIRAIDGTHIPIKSPGRERGIAKFEGVSPCIIRIREKLMKYNGGEIICEKNEIDGIAKICINHAEKRNAISGKMMVDFENVINELEKWKNGKGVILYGANEIFCSGGDLNFAKQENNAESGFEMAFFMQNILYKFLTLPLVSVAYISGLGAIGGGAELITACDFRLCSSETKTRISFVHSKMGIIPAWGGTKRLCDIVGKQKALDLILCCTLLNNNDALKINLIDQIVNNFDEAYIWLQNKVKADRNITRAIKASVINSYQISEDILEAERRIFAPLWGGPANKAALEKNIKHIK